MTPALMLDLLRRADEQWQTTLDTLPEPEWPAPSLLPGWSRSHVAAHVALNAEALAHALASVAGDGPPRPMYASPEARDLDIDALRTADVATLRERNREAAEAFAQAWSALPPEVLTDGRTLERTPGGPQFTVASVLERRWLEVEVHHADLGTGWSHGDWSPQFAAWLVSSRAAALPEVSLEATDTGQAWRAPEARTTVRGPVGALGWWLTGRGSGEGLVSDSGALPPQPSFAPPPKPDSAS